MRVTALAVCAAAALALTGCGGSGDGAAGGAEGGPAGGAASAAPSTTLAPVPVVKPSDMKPLVGRWTGTAGDFFQFRADGAGVWVKGGQRLWTGTVIPEGGGKYRFSWKGGDPQVASYWGVALAEDGRSLMFAGTSQTYKKAPARRAPATRGSG
ncbi:hypothetical protein E1200_14730 [Actinomadura sp. GC306]|uniref:hypothetical protein n=1 Tax=Actinomadura sp. GC306 TaxID=2530367 RepID=UPI001043FDDA|nr:hypothetical protein [Actinomadura sp. GC306]TDC67499.1 hypothetical protein E1200_14730 [Actinomadura sp. GC306]